MISSYIKRAFFLFLFGSLLLIALLFFSLCIGSTWIYPSQFFKPASSSIIWSLRFPRILLAIGVGGALAVSGHVLQIVLRNPLADPFILGISSASALGATLAFCIGSSFLNISLFSFLGSLLSLGFILLISQKKSSTFSHWLLLSGILLGFFCSSLVSLFLTLAHPYEGSMLLFWLMGSVSKPFSLPLIGFILGFIFFLCFMVQRKSMSLNVLGLGEEGAQTLGVRVQKEKKLFLLFASLLTSISVSVTGMIGFVGLIIPHGVRLIWGGDSRIGVFLNFILGACFLLVVDTCIRFFFVQEIPIGIITSLIGAPLFMVLLWKKS